MKNFIFLFVLLSSFLSLSSGIDFLKSQKRIRLFVDGRAPGLGHQSSSFKLIDRIFELGWEGELDIITDDKNSLPKIKLLCPEFTSYVNGFALGRCRLNNRDVYIYNSKDSYKLFRADLLLSGGLDTDIKDIRPYNSKNALILQPMNWSMSSYFLVKERRNKTVRYDLSVNIRNLGFIESIKGPDGLIEKSGKNFSSFKKSESYKILNYLENKSGGLSNLNYWSIYGLFERIPYEGNTAVRRLKHLVGSLGLSTGFIGRNDFSPFCIFAFNELQNEIKSIDINELKAMGYVVVRSLKELESVNLKTEVPVILLENVPRHLFNFFLMNSSLPPVVGGQGTKFLLDYYGKPYIPLGRELIRHAVLGYWKFRNQVKMIEDYSGKIHRIDQGFLKYRFDSLDSIPLILRDSLNQILIQSLDPNWEMNKFWTDFSLSLRQKKGKVLQSLERMEQKIPEKKSFLRVCFSYLLSL